MKLYYLVGVDIDLAAIVADNPPESIIDAVASELRTALDDSSVRGALGVVRSLVRPISEDDAEEVLS